MISFLRVGTAHSNVIEVDHRMLVAQSLAAAAGLNSIGRFQIGYLAIGGRVNRQGANCVHVQFQPGQHAIVERQDRLGSGNVVALPVHDGNHLQNVDRALANDRVSGNDKERIPEI